MSLRLPDFVIAGAPRSGTTWLTSALDRHPEIWLAKPTRPEPKFFLVDELYELGIEEYSRRWFADAPNEVQAGEKSTNYLESPIAAERMAAHLPDVRLLFVLRDPVERAISNYRWSVSNDMEHEDFATAIDSEDEREATLEPRLRYARPYSYVSRGRYAELLRPWLDLFPREQVAVIRFEDLVGDAAGTVAGIHEHLGVQPRPELAGQIEGINPSPDDPEVDEETVRRLRAHYAPLNEDLAALLGPQFRPWRYEE
jgi:LPS sulfotransferase NodH